MLRHTPYEKAFENKMNKMIMDFIWLNKRRYISKDIIFQKTKCRGMGALAVGKVWTKVLRSWFERSIDSEVGTQILEIAKDEYRKEHGHNPSGLFIHGIVAGKRIKKEKSVLKSAFQVQRWCWSKFLDGEDFENQPLIDNPRILKDKVTAQIKKENLPAFDETTIPTTLCLEKEIKKIENKSHKTLTDILTAHLMNRLDPCRSVVLRTKEKQPKKTILTKFKKSCPSSIMKLLKLREEAAKERVIKTAKNTLEESNPGLANFVEKMEGEIKSRNLSNNRHLDNKLLRIRKKIKYGALVTKSELHKWKITEDNNCSFCGIQEENLEHLLVECKTLEPLWKKAESIIKRKWNLSPNILDKKMGLKLRGEASKKAEKNLPQDSLAYMGYKTQRIGSL